MSAREEPSSEDGRPSKKSKQAGAAGAAASSSSASAMAEKGTGLRHFSMQVCKKVEEKGTTTHNEVADELVQEILEEKQRTGSDVGYDEKNIRRRVYDAINVLMAMDIISKHRKEIRWRGLPSAAQHEREQLQRERAQLQKRVRWKQQHLKESLVQLLCIHKLREENAHAQSRAPESASVMTDFVRCCCCIPLTLLAHPLCVRFPPSCSSPRTRRSRCRSS